MKIRTLAYLSTLAIALSSCFNQSHQTYHVIPQPNQINLNSDESVKVSSIHYNTQDTTLRNIAAIITNRMQMPLDGIGKTVNISLNDSITNPEAYSIVSTMQGVDVVGSSYAGVFYGLLTLKQIDNNGQIPLGIINDAPRFAWRGGMLDVARHFQPIENIKQYIDMLAFHKLNKFHWHLTDGIGWRIAIEKYPELTRRGAWRTEEYPEAPWVNLTLATEDSLNTHGGFYTKEQIAEVIQYAQTRYIEVIPEIEMPGHSEAATFCYPQYSCSNAKIGNGVYCAGKDETFTFLFDILDEVAQMFPSQYIHIGGDEVEKGQWNACPDCQNRIKSEKLQNEHQLQSYFVHRISDHLKSRGKILLGWDEIMEGGLANDAVVMSWTGWENGIKAAQSGHKVVMCPLDYVYLDHYQSYNNFEPQGWGGHNNLKRVYDFPVIPEGLEKKYEENILGGQGNLWTENITDWQHVQYMLLPRMAALSEALWSTPKNKNWELFTKKLDTLFDRYKSRGWNYSQSAYTPIVAQISTNKSETTIKLNRELDALPLYYTTDGSTPTISSHLYDTAITINSRTTIKAATLDQLGAQKGYTLTLDNLNNLASGTTVKYLTIFNKAYSGGGAKALVDNKFAVKRGDDKSWQGFEGEDMDIIIDLGSQQSVSNIDLRFFQHKGSTSVMLPTEVTIEVSNQYKTGYKTIVTKTINPVNNHDAMIVELPLTFKTIQTQYIQIKAKNAGTLPVGHPRAGAKAWIFTDEIAIY